MKNLFSIGETSKIKGVTIKALRYYHEEGILIPKYIDKETGYRYYSLDQFVQIDVIKMCRVLDCNIKEIREVFKECDTEKLLEFLESKKRQVKLKIKEMEEVIDNIGSLNELVKESKEILNQEGVNIREFKERKIITTAFEENDGQLKELLYNSSLDKLIKEKNIEKSGERGIIFEVLGNEIKAKEVFNGISGNHKGENIKKLPKGKYLTFVYDKGTIESVEKEVKKYLKEKNIKAKSFLVLELFDDIFSTDSEKCQIQILLD